MITYLFHYFYHLLIRLSSLPVVMTMGIEFEHVEQTKIKSIIKYQDDKILLGDKITS